MTILKLLPALLILNLYSCKQNADDTTINQAAVELNNKAMTLVPFIKNADSAKKAISLLDRATSIDSNYFLGHHNKIMFYSQLNQLDKAILTVNKLIELSPNAYDMYLKGGILHELIDDSISSKPYFERSLTICNAVLDTMSKTNSDYEMLVGNKAMNLKMLGDEAKANELLQQLYDSQTNKKNREAISLFMNKSKRELVAQFKEGNNSKL
jgi:tetratricopeptide (TPR) repeat protein